MNKSILNTMNNNINIYNDWYILFVRSTTEFYIKNAIDKHTNNQYQLFIFTKELLHKNQKKIIKVNKPLFPGYIFVYKDIYEIIQLSRNILPCKFIKAVSFNKFPAKVNENDMRLLLYNCDNYGVFNLSNYSKINNEVIITDGPLKNITGKIIFLNEKKMKAKVQINLFNRTVNLSLGINNIKDIQVQ